MSHEQITVDISTLTPLPGYPRVTDPSTGIAARAFVKEFGQVEPVIINDSNQVVWGMEYVEALDALGKDQVHAIVLPGDWDHDRQMALCLTLYNVRGEWDEPLLADLVGELTELCVDMVASGFTSLEIKDILSDPEGEVSDPGGEVSDPGGGAREEELPEYLARFRLGTKNLELLRDTAERLEEWTANELDAAKNQPDIVTGVVTYLHGRLFDGAKKG